MKFSALVAAAVIALVAGCATPEEEAASADAELKQKRMQLADEYQECTSKANAYAAAVKEGKGDEVDSDDRVEMSQCEDILKTLEALK